MDGAPHEPLYPLREDVWVTTADSEASSASKPKRASLWLTGARPRTLPLSVVPVAVGVGVAANYVATDSAWYGHISWWRVAIAFVVGLALQVGVNYANDYSDGIRGTDADRVGPLRLTASAAVPAKQVRHAAFICFGIAAAGGLGLAISISYWLLLVGVASIASAWFYTGGRSPYGYRGLGDIAVFVFFGLVAVMGTAYVAGDEPQVTWLALWAGIPVGLLAVAVLVANNLRDLPKDALVDKRTSAVRLGDRRTRIMYALCVGVPIAIGALLVAPICLPLLALAALVAFFPIRTVLRGAKSQQLISVIAATGGLQVVYGLALLIGLFVRAPW